MSDPSRPLTVRRGWRETLSVVPLGRREEGDTSPTSRHTVFQGRNTEKFVSYLFPLVHTTSRSGPI